MSLLRCERCGVRCDTGVTCDPCHAALLEGFLKCSYWLTWYGPAAGDRPGETRKDSYSRELESLRLSIRSSRGEL